MNQAFRPNFLTMPSMTRENKPEGKPSDEEIALDAMANLSGWRYLTEFIEALKKDLDTLNYTAISNGATFEEIGKNAVVVNMAKEVINRILTKVSDAKEAVEKLNE
jgi:hypothetical protein